MLVMNQFLLNYLELQPAISCHTSQHAVSQFETNIGTLLIVKAFLKSFLVMK